MHPHVSGALLKHIKIKVKCVHFLKNYIKVIPTLKLLQYFNISTVGVYLLVNEHNYLRGRFLFFLSYDL